MKKTLVVFLVVLSAFCVYAGEKISFGLNGSPYSFEWLKNSTTSYCTDFEAAAGVSFEYMPQDNVVFGADVMTAIGLSKKQPSCKMIVSYVADVKVGGYYDLGSNRIGGSVKVGVDAAHLHPYSSASLMLGGEVYYKYLVNELVSLKTGVDVQWAKNKGGAGKGNLNSLMVIPSAGVFLTF